MITNLYQGIERVTPDELIGSLNEIEKKYAPDYLYIKGDRNILCLGSRVSIIGSRNPSKEGLNNACSLTKSLVKHQIIIVSGLAKGIDTIAHKTAIQQCGQTIAVLGTPLDSYYPPENRQLQDEIMKNYLAISQFPPKSSIQRGNFPRRNRTMALLSHASVIIEAGDTSGSLHQGWEALRLGRSLFILDSVLKNDKLKWPEEMIKYGAIVLSIKQVKSLLDILPTSGGQVNIDVAF